MSEILRLFIILNPWIIWPIDSDNSWFYFGWYMHTPRCGVLINSWSNQDDENLDPCTFYFIYRSHSSTHFVHNFSQMSLPPYKKSNERERETDRPSFPPSLPLGFKLLGWVINIFRFQKQVVITLFKLSVF